MSLMGTKPYVYIKYKLNDLNKLNFILWMCDMFDWWWGEIIYGQMVSAVGAFTQADVWFDPFALIESFGVAKA